MKKITLFLAALLTASVAMADIVVEKVWDSTADIRPVADAKQGAGYDGTFYIQDKGTSKIYAYTKTGATVTCSEYAASGVGLGFDIDDAGNMICRDAYFAAAAPASFLIYKKGETTGKQVTFTLLNPGRTDYNTVSGNIFSAEGGYVWFYSNGSTVVNYVKITNGAATAADVTVGAVGTGLVAGTSTSVVYQGSLTSIICQPRSNQFQQWTTGNTPKTVSPDGSKISTLGACMFTIKNAEGIEKEIWAYNSGTTNYDSEFKVRNMTDKVDIATGLKIEGVTGTSTAYANWLTVSKINEKSYYLHQIWPGKAIALYKVYDNTPEPADPKRVYCKMEQSWWKTADAAVGAYMWTTDPKVAWPGERMTPVAGETDIWYVDVDTTAYKNIIFTRVSGSGDVAEWGAQTVDLVIPTDENDLFTITTSEAAWSGDGNKCVGTWSKYVKTPTSLSNVSVLQLRTLDGQVLVPAEAGQNIEIYSVLGQKVYSAVATSTETAITLTKGQIYIVRVNGQVAKVRL